MDPVTVIGLVASIASLVKASKGILGMIKNFKDGDKDLAILAKDVAVFEETLKGFDRVLRSRQNKHNISKKIVEDALFESQATIQDLERRLLDVAKSNITAVRRMKMVQNKSGFLKIHERIKGHSSQLVNLVQIAHTEAFFTVMNQHPQFMEICANVAEEMQTETESVFSDTTTLVGSRSSRGSVSSPRGSVSSPRKYSDTSWLSPTELPSPTVSPRGSVSSLGSSLSSGRGSSPTGLSPRGSFSTPAGPRSPTSPRGSATSMRKYSDSTTLDIPGSDASSAASSFRRLSVSASSTSSGKPSFDSSSSASTAITEPDNEDPRLTAQKTASRARETGAESMIIRAACRFDCYCKCHTQSVPVSPEILSNFNSPIFQPTKNSKIPCTEPDCAGASTSGVKVIPSTFFKKAVSHLVQNKSIKIRYHMNTYRMIPEGSDAMRYVKHGNLEKLKVELTSGQATIWDTAPDGWSLLHTAAYARQLPIVKYLTELGADTDAADLGARKPADLALLKSFGADATRVEEEIVEVFSKKDDYISDFEFTPIHIATLDLYDSEDRERPTLTQLIAFVDDANNAPPGTNWSTWKAKYQRRSPLFLAIIEQFRVSAFEKGTTHKVIHNLLDQKDRKFHWTPLHWASSSGRADKMKILLEHGANPFIQSNLNASIIHAAVECDAQEGLMCAIEIAKKYPKKLDLDGSNIWGETPLHMCAQGCLIDCVKLLLAAGADRNRRQENHQVPLHYCGLSKRGEKRREVVRLLCGAKGETGEHINAQDEDGRPPVFDFLDDPDSLQDLIDHGADLNLLDHNGRSLLHHICIQNEPESLALLLAQRNTSDILSLVTLKSEEGNTPLIEAMRNGSADCAMLLLEFEDVGDVVGQDGWAVAHHAAKLGDEDVLEAVLRHPSYAEGPYRTTDGKTVDEVAMDAGNWTGRNKDLVRKYSMVHK